MELFKIIMEAITQPQVIAALFAISALILAIPLVARGNTQFATQLLGSMLVVAISFSANNAAVYTISVFVIATLVTELHFLEKIAALIWNRKEYWNYLTDTASKEEVKGKAKAEVVSEIQNTDEPDEVESLDPEVEQPKDILDTNSNKPKLSPKELVSNALKLEKDVFECLKKEIPFSYKNLNQQVKILSGSRKYIIDIIIETDNVHYLIEVKNYQNPSSLVKAAHQINDYVAIYKEYLRERKLRVSVQPLIVIPDSLKTSNSIKGIPIVTFSNDSKVLTNFNQEYADYELNDDSITTASLRALLIKFLGAYSKWAFSPLRIQKWGSKQATYETLAMFTTKEIKHELDLLLNEGVLTESTSKKGNKLFRIKLNTL